MVGSQLSFTEGPTDHTVRVRWTRVGPPLGFLLTDRNPLGWGGGADTYTEMPLPNTVTRALTEVRKTGMEAWSKASKLQAEGWACVIRLQNGFPWVRPGAKR